MKNRVFLSILVLVILIGFHWVSKDNNSTKDDKSLYQQKKEQAKLERESRNERKKTPGSFRSFKMFNSVRSYPNSNIPAGGFTKGVESHNLLTTKERGDHSWEPIGPANIGGRTLDIAIHPDNPETIYAGSASGGLWRNSESGLVAESWERLDLGYPGLAVSAVEISPDNPDIIYVGTGEVYGSDETHPGISNRVTRGMYGIGILKSVDGGSTWSKSLDWSYSEKQGVQRIMIESGNHQKIWAATSDGLYRSSNAGGEWSKVLDIPMVTDIVLFPDSTDVIIAGCGGMFSEGHGIYRSIDGGESWSKRTITGGPSTFGGKVRLDYAKSSPNIVYGSIGYSNGQNNGQTWLTKSVDYGKTWSVINSTNYADYQGWYSHYVKVDPSNKNKLFLGGIHLYQSVNGGVSMAISEGMIDDWFHPDWLHLDHHDMEFDPTNPDILYMAHDGGVHRSTDGGVTFLSCNWGYQTSQFYSGYSLSESDSTLAMGGLQDNFSCIYRGEKNWDRVIGGDGSHSAISQLDNDIIFGSWQGLNILRSTDRGYSFDADVTPPEYGSVNFIAPFILSPADGETLYAGRARVYKSENLGSNWDQTAFLPNSNSNPVIALAMDSSNPDIVYCATSPVYSRGDIFKSVDGGDSWIKITGNLPDRHPTDIGLDPEDSEIIYITFGGFGEGHLYRSDDGGESWSNISSELPDLPAWSIVVDPFNREHIYFGNDIGVYFSNNSGEDWESFNSGFGDGVVAMDLLVSKADKKLKIATHGNGSYERRLNSSLSSIGEERVKDLSFTLNQNYPNPFNNSTTISYSLTLDNQLVKLKVFNLQGQLISTLVNNRVNSGNHEVLFSGDNISSGQYLISLEVEGRRLERVITLLK